MNRTIALSCSLALAAAAAGHARAGGSGDIMDVQQAGTSTLTRAEVLADLQQFRASGINPWADDHDPLRQFRSTRTRAEVMADFYADRDVVTAQGREDSGSMYVARRQPTAPADVQVAKDE